MSRKALIVIALFLITTLKVVGQVWDQNRFERMLGWGCTPDDDLRGETPTYVHLRERDALAEFPVFFSRSGWTTNQFLEGLMLAVTNAAPTWTDEERERIAGTAMWKLSEINRPAVTNFFHHLIDEGRTPLATEAIPAIFRYTNLEPEIFDYLRTQCVRTNLYEGVAYNVVYELQEAVETLPAELKPAATNRVARFIYYSIRHSRRTVLSQDNCLAEFLPAYSNSVQRLATMQYVISVSTNSYQRGNAQAEFDRLTALPANQLNNLNWITEGE